MVHRVGKERGALAGNSIFQKPRPVVGGRSGKEVFSGNYAAAKRPAVMSSHHCSVDGTTAGGARESEEPRVEV
jgi:hypothetical protein